MNEAAVKLITNNVQAYVEVQNAYLECSAEIREVVDDMVAIFRDQETDNGERSRALATIVEALFPSLAADLLVLEKSRRQSPAGEAVEKEMDRQEAAFAERLQVLMKAKGLTQSQLAQLTGVGQPAISNMLNRCARPQERTIAKYAKSLGVSTSELWPDE